MTLPLAATTWIQLPISAIPQISNTEEKHLTKLSSETLIYYFKF